MLSKNKITMRVSFMTCENVKIVDVVKSRVCHKCLDALKFPISSLNEVWFFLLFIRFKVLYEKITQS